MRVCVGGGLVKEKIEAPLTAHISLKMGAMEKQKEKGTSMKKHLEFMCIWGWGWGGGVEAETQNMWATRRPSFHPWHTSSKSFPLCTFLLGSVI